MKKYILASIVALAALTLSQQRASAWGSCSKGCDIEINLFQGNGIGYFKYPGCCRSNPCYIMPGYVALQNSGYYTPYSDLYQQQTPVQGNYNYQPTWNPYAGQQPMGNGGYQAPTYWYGR